MTPSALNIDALEHTVVLQISRDDLSKEENKTVVKFTLPENNKTIFTKEYKLYLPSKDQLKKQLA